MICGMRGIFAQRPLTEQEKITAEWDAMSGEWDDLAKGYAHGFYQDVLLRHNSSKSPIHKYDKECDSTNDHELKNLDDVTSRSSADMPQFRLDGTTILDFGCGTGLLTDKLRHSAARIIALDASSKMMNIVQDKILSGEWDNVIPLCGTLAQLEINTQDAHGGNVDKQQKMEQEQFQRAISNFYGAVDLIVASSVLTCIPDEDLPVTMTVLSQLLKPGIGMLVHSDWPQSEAKHPDAMTRTKALRLYATAKGEAAVLSSNKPNWISEGGAHVKQHLEDYHPDSTPLLQPLYTDIIDMNVGGGETLEVFVGVAQRTA